MAHVAVNRDTGEPDAVMLADRARYRARLRTRLVISIPLAMMVTVATVVVIVTVDHPWTWTLFYCLCALLLVGTINLVDEESSRRPRPDTALETAVIVGIETISWGRADGNRHDVRVIARPIGSTRDELVHGYTGFDARQGCRIRPGMHVGVRRFPGLRHYVWLDSRHDPLTLLALRAGGTLRSTATTAPASVESVTIGEDRAGDWWETTVTVRTDDGTRLHDTCLRLPEELARFEPGARVDVLPGDRLNRCVIVPTTP